MIKNQISNVSFVPGVLHYGSKKIHKTQTTIFSWRIKRAINMVGKRI